MITVQIKDPDKVKEGLAEVEITCDAAGLEVLKRHIGFLKRAPNHVHLMTPEWAGAELDSDPIEPGCAKVNHLRITLVD